MSKKKTTKKRKSVSKREINATLKSIYQDEDGKKIDMRVHKIKKQQSGGRRILIGLIVFFALIAVVSWLGVLIFSRLGGGGLDNLQLEISGKKQVSATDEIEYQIKYINKEDIPLASAEIGLYMPKSFIISESKPVLDEKNKLKIGTLKSGQGGIIKIKGKFFAAEGDKETLQAVLTYKPSNFNSNFQKVATIEVEISGSAFDGSLEGPDKLVAGDGATYKLTYKNKSDEDLENVAIDVVLPGGFIISTSTPQIDKNKRWNIGKLESKSEGEVLIKGSFGSDAAGDKDIIFKLGALDKDKTFLTLIEKKSTTNVVGGDMITTLMINGKDNFNTARWGDSLNYSITYENEGKDTLYDITLRMIITGLPKESGKTIVDWSKFNDLNKGQQKEDTIVWTKKQVSSLGKLKPNGKGVIDFTLGIIPKPTNPSYKDYKIDSILEIEIARAGNLAVKRKLQSNKITTFINSDTAFISEARYYDDGNSQIGSGPIPPKVGQKTTYKIYWKVANSMHELEEMRVSGVLPSGAVFSGGKADAGTVALDSSLKKVEWTLNRLPTSVHSISAEFDMTLTPGKDDVGSSASILEKIIFTAKDKSTGGTITISGGDETTTLPDDPYVTSGEVQGS